MLAQAHNFLHHEQHRVVRLPRERALRVDDAKEDAVLLEPCAGKLVVMRGEGAGGA